MQFHTLSLKHASTVGLILLSACPASAWSDWGHEAVARIAYSATSPQVQQWVDAILQQHPDPDCHKLEAAAAWPDSIRRERPETRSWHYIDLAVEASPHEHLRDPHNVVWAVGEMRQRVLQESGPARAEAMAFLIHFVADVHQPLHVSCLYNEDMPDGDAGGNKVAIVLRLGGNLHRFWDLGGGRHPEDLPRLEHTLEKEHPPRKEQNVVQDPMQWAQETHAFGVHAYQDLDWQKLPELTANYIHRAEAVSDERMVVAAYRLSATLTNLYRRSHS